jgi:predicted RecB family nuclease
MQLRDGTTLFSASDLVNFMGCTHATMLDLRQLVAPVEFPPDDEQARLLQQKGLEHEYAYLAKLKAEGRIVVEIVGDTGIEEKTERTRAALREGADVIYQGAFREGIWQGYSDFLLKVPRASALGDFSYQVADTKLSRSAKPKHVIQMCIYSDILAREQGVSPELAHVCLGDGTVASVRVEAVIHYFRRARMRFLEFTDVPPETSESSPCGHCTFCRWASVCDAEWEAGNHLSIVAGPAGRGATRRRHPRPRGADGTPGRNPPRRNSTRHALEAPLAGASAGLPARYRRAAVRASRSRTSARSRPSAGAKLW